MVEIVEGKFYKTRDGRKVGPMRKAGYGWVADSGRVMASDYIDWYNKGNYHYYNETSHDLIEEWKEEACPSKNQIREWGNLSLDNTQMFKVGDRVQSKSGDDFYNGGKVATVVRLESDKYSYTQIWLDTGYWTIEKALVLADTKPSSPVQSRKTIVEGEYGNLSIYYKHDQPKTLDSLRIEVTTSKHTAQELREMIRVLGDIVEFLEEAK